MEEFNAYLLKESFEIFEKAAMRGHEESQWIWNVVKDMELSDENKKAIEKAFAETGSPLGYYFAGRLCDGSRERFDYMKRSSDCGCSWGQVEYANYFHPDPDWGYVEKDEEAYSGLIEKAATQKNPQAMFYRGLEHYEKIEYVAAVADFRIAAELGWRYAKQTMSRMLFHDLGVEKDLVQAAYWGSATRVSRFWEVLREVEKAWKDKAFGDLGCDFHRLAMEIGRGLYWYQYGTKKWDGTDAKQKEFGIKCLDYYSEAIELQQKAIFLFVLYWNKTTGVKNVGRMIGQIVWEGRYDCLVKEFGD